MQVTKKFMVPIDFYCMERNKKNMEVSGDQILFGYQYSSKYLILGSTEEIN